MIVNLLPKFQLGMTVVTPGVLALLKFPMMPAVELAPYITRHAAGDWGDMPPEDCASNDAALELGNRVMSSYVVNGEKIWIITESDRSVTTALLPDEY